LHALGLSAWKQHLAWDAQNLEVDGRKVHKIVDEMELPWGRWTKDMTRLVDLAKGGGLVPRGLEGQYEGLAMDSEDNWEDTMEIYDIDPDEVDLELVREVLRRSIAQSREVIDFNDMLYMPVIARAEFLKTDVVFLDEAQDVNGIQAEIVDRMRHSETRVIAVGDPNQAIYGFRGALSDSMSQLQHRFHCRPLPLSVSYRCPRAVVKQARQWVSHILSHENALEGLVDHAADWPVGSFQPGDAILCRNSAPVITIAFLLIRNKIAAKVVGRDIGQGLVKLVEKMKARTIVDLEERLVVYRAREAARAKGKEAKIAALDDKLETIRVFMDEAGPHAGIGTLIANIEALFGEGQDMRGMVTCSTVHKSKGLEFERVFILDADLYMPSKWARQPWERQQENNLCYVAATRAKRELRYISSDGLREVVNAKSMDGSEPAIEKDLHGL
jgi:superfamily I DNA/RNA helicase